MTQGTYTGSQGTYEGTQGVYATVAERIPRVFMDAFEWGDERSLRDHYDMPHHDGRVVPAAAYRGDYGLRTGHHGMAAWAWPPRARRMPKSERARPRGQHDYYPEKGDEFCTVVRIRDWRNQYNWTVWPLSFGMTPASRWHRNLLQVRQDGDFRAVVYTKRGWDLMDRTGPGGLNLAGLKRRWLVYLVKWFHPETDDRTGWKAFVFDAETFPFEDWSYREYQLGNLSVSPIAELDTAAGIEGDDNQDLFANEGEHRFGVGTQEHVKADFDEFELFLIGREPPRETLIEGFEGGRLGSYAGDTASFAVQTETVIDGRYTLEAVPSADFHSIQNTTISGPARGDSFSYKVMGTGGSGSVCRADFSFAYESDDNRYLIDTDIGAQEVRFHRRLNGTLANLAESTSVPLSTNTTYIVEVDWDGDGRFELTWQENRGGVVAKLGPVFDKSHSGGGIQWRAQTGVDINTYYDSLSIVR